MSFWQEEGSEISSEQQDFTQSQQQQSPVSYGQQEDNSYEDEDDDSDQESFEAIQDLNTVNEAQIYKEHQNNLQQQQALIQSDMKRQNSYQNNTQQASKKRKGGSHNNSSEPIDLSKNISTLMSLSEKLQQQQQQFLQEQQQSKQENSVVENDEDPSTQDGIIADSQQQQSQVVLQLQNQRNQGIKIQIGIKEPFSKLFYTYRDRAISQKLFQKSQIDNVQFRFDGDVLQNTQSAQQLGMEDGDIIDVIIRN